MDEAMRNAIGRIFARQCDVLELWEPDGPLPQLRDDVGEGRDGPLSTPQKALMRVALDLYDGTGRITVREALAQMGGDIDIISTFAEFVMGHMAPGMLEDWAKAHQMFNESSTH